jgi:hypothetical protein
LGTLLSIIKKHLNFEVLYKDTLSAQKNCQMKGHPDSRRAGMIGDELTNPIPIKTQTGQQNLPCSFNKPLTENHQIMTSSVATKESMSNPPLTSCQSAWDDDRTRSLIVWMEQTKNNSLNNPVLSSTKEIRLGTSGLDEGHKVRSFERNRSMLLPSRTNSTSRAS